MDTIPFQVDDLKVTEKLFAKIRYCVAGTVDPKILKLLEDGQGVRRTNALVSTTHVIAGPDADAMTIEEAKDLFDLPVVRPSWVAFCAKFNTIVPTWGFSAAKDQVFLDVVITSFGLTPDDVKKLWASVVYHGGRYSTELSGDVTHVIAHSSKIPVYNAAKNRNLPVVCLDWVNDCVRASKLVNPDEYDPSLLKSPVFKGASQPLPPRPTATPAKKEAPKTPGRILSGSHSSPTVTRLKSGDLGSSAVLPISTPPPAPKPKTKASQGAAGTGATPKRATKSPSQAKSTTPKKEAAPAAIGQNPSTLGMPSLPLKTPNKKVSTFATPVGPPTPGVQHSPMSKVPPQSPLSSPIPQSPSKSPGPGSVPPMGGQSPAHHGAAVSMTSPHSNPQTPTSHQQMLSHLQGSNQQSFLQPPQSPSGAKGSMMMSNQQIPFQSVPQPQQSPQHSMVHSPQAQQKMMQHNFSMKSPLGSQPMQSAGMHHSPVQSPSQSVASPLQGQNMGFADQNQMMQMQNNQGQFNQKLMSPMHQSEQDMQQMMGSPMSRQQMMQQQQHHKPQQYGANQTQPGSQGSFQQQVPVSQNQGGPKLQQHLMGQQMQPQGNQPGMMQMVQQNMGGGNYQMNQQQMNYQQQMNQQMQHSGQQMPMQQHQHMMQKQGNLQMQQGTNNVQVPQQSPQHMQSNSPLQHSQMASQQLQMQSGMHVNQQGPMSQQNQQQQPGMMQVQNNMSMLQSPSTPPINQNQFSQQQGQGQHQMQQNRQFQIGQQQIPMNQGNQMSQQLHVQQGQMPMQQGQMQPGMGQQMQMQQGQSLMQGSNTILLPQGQQMQQLQNQRMQLQQTGPGQMQMQQPGQGQMQMQQPGPGQMQMQQPGPGQMQMQQPGQGQMQMQQTGPGQMQMQQPGQGQMQMQQPGQVQMQQPGPGQMQMHQPGQGQMQMQQPGQGQMQMQQSGPGQMQMKQQGIPQQMQLQGQQGGSLQQMQNQGGMQPMQMQQGMTGGMQMQSQGGPQMTHSGVQQQNMSPMQVANQPGSPQIQQQGQLGNQVQNMPQGQYQYQLQQGQNQQQGQQVVQVLQVPGQMQQNMIRGPTGNVQMRQQGVVTQQMNINQVRMGQNAPRQMMNQQQTQQLRSTLPMSPQMAGMQGQQRPMQPQQTMMGQQQQVDNRMQLSGGQHIVNVNAQNDQNQPSMVQFQQAQPQPGSQQLQQLLQQPHSQQQQQGIRQPGPGQQVPMNPVGVQQQGGQPMPQPKPFGLRPQIQQEIIRQISSDANLKQQFQMMDQQQRSLWVQQFIQRQRDKDQQMLLQQRMVNQQVQQQRFVGAGTGQMGANVQRPQGQMVVQPGGVVRTQQIFTPQVGSPRLNVRHVLVHQGSRLTQPQGQTQQIIIQQQQGAQMPPQQSPQHGQNVNQIILQSGAGQQLQNQMPIQQSQGSQNLNQQQQIIHVQVPGQAGMQQIIRQPGQPPGTLQGSNVAPQATQQNIGPRTQIIGPNNVLIQQTSTTQQGLPGQQQLPPGAKVALIQSSQQWVTPGGTVVRSPSPASQMQGLSRPGMDGSMSPAGTMQGQWPVRQGSPVGTPPGFVQNQANIPYVNSKTKTALANLLSNRLQGNTGDPTMSGPVPVGVQSPQQQVVMCPPPPPPVNAPPSHGTLGTVQMQTSPQQNLLVQRTPLNTMAGGMKPVQRPLIRTPGGIPPPPGATLPLAQRPTYYGHDPNQKLPADGFLLGCVFWVPIPLSVKNLKEIVEERWGELEQENGPRVTHVLCETTKFPEFQQVVKEGKRLVTLHWLSDCCVKKIVKPPCYAIHLPLPFLPEDKPLKDDLIGITGFSGENKQRVELMCNMLGAQVVKHLARNIKMLVANKPEGSKFAKAREWKMPVVNVQFLNELLFGHLSSLKNIHSPKYQQFNSEPFRFEVALVPHLMASWKQPIRFNQEHLDKYNVRKRSADGQIDAPGAKRQKLEEEEKDMEPLTPPEIPVDENHPATTSTDNKNLIGESVPEDIKPDIKKDVFNRPVSVMLSGFTRDSKEKITKKILQLGGKVTGDYRETTHLIMKESLRTNKLFVCLSRARYIVTLDWLRECLKKNYFVDAEPFIMSNETIENVYGVKLKDLLAKPDRHMLFDNVTFFVTPSCFPSVPDLHEIIEAAGGQIDKKQRSLQFARQQALKSPRRYVIITCTQDFKLVADACKRHTIHLHTPEFIFDSIAKNKFKPLKSFAKLLPLGDKGGFKLPLQARKV